MARNTSISLDEHFGSFVDAQVQTGHYSSASEVVRAGLRLLEERDAKVRALQDALIAGEQSGDSTPFDFDAFIESKRAMTERR